MNFIESFKSAIYSVRANKMRSFLTMSGIIIGISSVITIVSIGQGGKKAITGQFEKIGMDIINIKVKTRDSNVEKRDLLTLNDAKSIKNKIPEVTYVIPYIEGFCYFKTEDQKREAAVGAVTEDFTKLINLKMLSGRFLNKNDLESGKNVIVIDDLTAMKIFGRMDVLGEKIRISSGNREVNTVVIGVCENNIGDLATMFGDNYPSVGYFPLTIADRVLGYTDLYAMTVAVDDMSKAKEISSRIIRLLEQSHRNRDKYIAEEGFKEMDMVNNIMNIFTGVLGAIAGISLLVGGIGVMNIMLVSVTEGTREIGIRKALDTKNRDK
ncbi:MAG: macrolide ABC transporter permease, partial [Clostridiales bacterium]|nr:macrolide ABC transporter permease [Clostridiales bacterium]